jgi:hypothetical protein
MSWDDTLVLPVIYTFHPTVEDHGMVVTSRKKRFVELSQQQQAGFGHEWQRTKFITVQAMCLKPSEGFRPLHWFVLHRRTLLHTSPIQKRQWFWYKLSCQMVVTLKLKLQDACLKQDPGTQRFMWCCGFDMLCQCLPVPRLCLRWGPCPSSPSTIPPRMLVSCLIRGWLVEPFV